MEADTNRPDIIQKFHNLEGVHIGEKRKNLYKWLKCTTFSDEDKNVLLFGITPQSYLEELFKLEILIFFKRTNELLEIMKDGNEVFISKIIKKPWFIQEAFRTMDGRTFVNEFLPCLSFSMRFKVLGKVSHFASEAQMDDIFSCFLDRYGIFASKQFLTRCSSKKIEDFLKTNEGTTLSMKQCKELYDKDPNLFLFYLKDGFDTISNRVWKYIADNNFDFFLKVQDKFGSLSTRFGKRSSSRIAKNKTGDVINDFSYYKDKLKKSILIRKFRPTYKQMLINSKSHSEYTIYKEMKFFPKKFRWEIFSEIYSGITKKDILEDLVALRWFRYEQILPDRKIQIQWAKVNFKDSEDLDYLSYFDFDEGFTIIKEKISVTSNIQKRQTLLKTLILLCKNNDDLRYLEQALQYIGYRHKHEKAYIRESILYELSSSYKFKLESLEEVHWRYINDQMKLLRLTNDVNSYSTQIDLLSYYLMFLCRNNKPFEEELKQFVQDMEDSGYAYTLSETKDFPEVRKKLLVAMSDYIMTRPDITFEKAQSYILELINYNEQHKDHFINIYEITSVKNFIVNLFSKADALDEEYKLRATILNYNIDYVEKVTPLYTVEEFPNILKSFKKADKYIIDRYIRSILIRLIKNPKIIPTRDILDIYFTELFTVSKEFEYKRFKYDLLTIRKYFDVILTKSFSKKSHFFTSYLSVIKKCSHLQLDSRLMSFCKKYLEPITLSSDETPMVENLFLCYSKILATDDFKRYVEKYLIPTEKKLDISNDEEQKKLYKFQCSILKYFKNVIEPSKMSPVVVQYCQGDYLNSAVPALYSIFYRSKETILPNYIDILAKKPLSAQKHALFLAAELLDSARYTKILTYLLSQAESNASKKHIIKSTFQYFIKNPNDELFDLILENMQFIDKNDEETLKMLCARNVPTKYQPVFIERYWLFLEDLEKNEIKVDAYITSLFEKIKSSIAGKLNFEFAEMIIRKYFFIDSYSNSAIELAFWGFIRSNPEQLEKYVTVVFDVIEQSKNDRTKIKFILEEVMLFSHNHNHILQPFSDRWKVLFNDVDYFEENLLLDMLKIKYECSGNNNLFVEKIVSLLELLVTQNDLVVYQIFSKVLEKIIEVDRNKMLWEILEYKNSRATCLLAIDLAVKANDSYCSHIFNIVKNSEDPLVKMFSKYK